ncbi:HSP20-like chaperone [Pilobolus umbonatus]|nr:HSP20-like chaperone [Pilobolus umbonatus]
MSLSQRFISDAFRDMQRAFSLLDQPLYEAARRAPAALSSQLSHGMFRYPATNMKETQDAYELQAELPGIDKKNIDIELSDSHTLVLRGSVNEEFKSSSGQETTQAKTETQESTENSTPSWWVNERVVGNFTRSFSFPTPIKADAIKASYQDGILNITVPKTVKESKKISID